MALSSRIAQHQRVWLKRCDLDLKLRGSREVKLLAFLHNTRVQIGSADPTSGLDPVLSLNRWRQGPQGETLNPKATAKS